MKKIILSFTAILVSNFLLAYPITPAPLRKLVMESECIIRGKVLEIGYDNQKDKKNSSTWDRDFAIIQVNEILKGRLTENKIKIYFCAGMICPAPGVFFQNEEALAFIDRREKKEGYEVHSLSYGVKHGLLGEGFNVYKARIKEMQDILNVENTREQEDLVLEWLVKCSENKTTRWEGVYELSPGSDFMSYYDQSSRHRKDIYLSKAQQQKLYDALLKETTLDYDDMALVDIVTGINDDTLLDLLKKGLTKTDTTYMWPAGSIMERIVRLTADKELEDLLKQFSELSFSYKESDKAESKRLLSIFIKKMQLANRKKPIIAAGRNSS